VFQKFSILKGKMPSEEGFKEGKKIYGVVSPRRDVDVGQQKKKKKKEKKKKKKGRSRGWDGSEEERK